MVAASASDPVRTLANLHHSRWACYAEHLVGGCHLNIKRDDPEADAPWRKITDFR